jgi:hypothetical protein
MQRLLRYRIARHRFDSGTHPFAKPDQALADFAVKNVNAHGKEKNEHYRNRAGQSQSFRPGQAVRGELLVQVRQALVGNACPGVP